jgi:hypothetical protein
MAGRGPESVMPTGESGVCLAEGEVVRIKEHGQLKRHKQRIAKGDRMTHVISLAKLGDVTAEVKRRLKVVYVAVRA